MSQFIRRKADPSKLQAQLEAVSGGNGFKQDLTEWKLTTDSKTKEGTAVIRFLQPSDLEGKEEWPTFVKIVNHFIKRNGKFYVENCSSTHGDYESCPACEWIKAQNWDWNVKADKEAMQKSGTGRNTYYWANIMVIKDPSNRENEGKVFKFRFGVTVLKMIQNAQKGDEDAGEAPIIITDMDEGANFVLRSTKKGEYGSLETSKFQAQSAIPGIDTEEVQQEILRGLQDLRPITDKSQFKPYAELKPKFDKLMGLRGGDERNASKANDELDSFEKDMNDFSASQEGSSKPETKAVVSEPTGSTETDGDDLDDLLAGL